MFATIRRHQKWLWFVVIVGVIVPFVWFMGPTYYGTGRGMRGRASFGRINDRSIDQEEYWRARREASLDFYLRRQQWPEDSEAGRQFLESGAAVSDRLFLLEKLRELQITADDASVADWITQVFRDPRNNSFSLELYQQFVRGELRRARMSEQDFRLFARHQVAIGELYSLGGISGALTPPREFELLFRRDHEQLTTELAVFSLSNHLTEIIITPEAVATFYTNQAARYRVPEMVQVAYARFATTNYLAEADQHLSTLTNLDAQLESIYRRQGPERFVDATGAPLTPEAAKKRIQEDNRQAMANVAARKAATAFAERLFEQYEREPGRLDHLQNLGASSNLTVALTEPFPRFGRPPGLLVGQDFAEVAFSLSTNQPMAMEPLIGQDGVYLIAFHRRIESFVPSLDDKRQQVTADYRRGEALRRAREAAQKFHSALTNSLAQGQTFDAACTAANVIPIRPIPFARSTESLPELADRVDLAQLKDIALDLPPGKVSDVEETRDGAVIVHLISRQPVDDARLKAELPAFASSLRDERRQVTSIDWLRREKDLAQISGLPEFEQRRNAPAPGPEP